jgi:hypothetical protein
VHRAVHERLEDHHVQRSLNAIEHGSHARTLVSIGDRKIRAHGLHGEMVRPGQ